MIDAQEELPPDREIAAHLRAMDAPLSAERVEELRVRIMVAAASRLADRASRARVQIVATASRARDARRPSWLDVTSGFSRIAIPLSLAAALIAMILLRQLPETAAVDDTTMAMASGVLGDSAYAPAIADELVLPESADDVLLAPFSSESRQ